MRGFKDTFGGGNGIQMYSWCLIISFVLLFVYFITLLVWFVIGKVFGVSVTIVVLGDCLLILVAI